MQSRNGEHLIGVAFLLSESGIFLYIQRFLGNCKVACYTIEQLPFSFRKSFHNEYFMEH